MKKFSIIFCILTLFLSVQSFAIPKGPCDVKDACCDEAAPGPFAFSYPKDVGLACPRDFYTYGEFLYMKGSEEGLDYGVTDTLAPIASPIVGEIIGFSSRSQEWDWSPGFRAGFGAYLNHDAWSVNVNWTYIRIKADSAFSVEPPNFINPLLIYEVFPPSPYLATSARWSGDFNTFDMTFGKPYHVSRYFISHPSFGVRAAWIDQDYHVRYFNALNQKFNSYFKNDFWGVGLRGLYEAELLLSSSWKIFGKAAFALLFGKFDTNAHSEVQVVLGNISVKDSFYGVKPNADLALGICWDKFFHKDQYRLSVRAAFEHHHWWHQNQMKESIFTIGAGGVQLMPLAKGDLAFNGFTFGIHLEF